METSLGNERMSYAARNADDCWLWEAKCEKIEKRASDRHQFLVCVEFEVDDVVTDEKNFEKKAIRMATCETRTCFRTKSSLVSRQKTCVLNLQVACFSVMTIELMNKRIKSLG